MTLIILIVKKALSKRMVLITCVRKVYLRLKSLGLIDYRVKMEFLLFNLLSSSFFKNKFDRIICISCGTQVLVSL